MKMHLIDILLPLVDAPVMEVQGNAAAAIGNLVTNCTFFSISNLH